MAAAELVEAGAAKAGLQPTASNASRRVIRFIDKSSAAGSRRKPAPGSFMCQPPLLAFLVAQIFAKKLASRKGWLSKTPHQRKRFPTPPPADGVCAKKKITSLAEKKRSTARTLPRGDQAAGGRPSRMPWLHDAPQFAHAWLCRGLLLAGALGSTRGTSLTLDSSKMPGLIIWPNFAHRRLCSGVAERARGLDRARVTPGQSWCKEADFKHA